MKNKVCYKYIFFMFLIFSFCQCINISSRQTEHENKPQELKKNMVWNYLNSNKESLVLLDKRNKEIFSAKWPLKKEEWEIIPNAKNDKLDKEPINEWIRGNELKNDLWLVTSRLNFGKSKNIYTSNIISKSKIGLLSKPTLKNYKWNHVLFDVVDETNKDKAKLFINGKIIPVSFNENWKSEPDMQGGWHTVCEDEDPFIECGIYGGFKTLVELGEAYYFAYPNL